MQEALVFVATLPGLGAARRAPSGCTAATRSRPTTSSVDDAWGVLNMVTLGTWIFVLGTWLTGVADPNFRRLVVFWGAAIVLVSCGRIVARALVRRTRPTCRTR